MVRVLVADDSKLMREALLHLLKSDPEIHLVGQAASFGQTLQLANEVRPDVIVMDLHMPDEKTLIPAAFKASLRGIKVIAISLWTDDENKAWAERLCAVSLLDKATLASELTNAIRQCQTNRHAAKA